MTENTTEEWIEVKSDFWKPAAENEFIIGTYVGTEETQYGGAAKIMTDSSEAKMVSGTALVSNLKGLEGKRVKIVYKGMKKSEKGREYKDFSVFVAKGEEKPAE